MSDGYRGYRRLAAAILIRACNDASNNCHAKDALEFLGGEWATFIAESLDLQTASLTRFVAIKLSSREGEEYG